MRTSLPAVALSVVVGSVLCGTAAWAATADSSTGIVVSKVAVESAQLVVEGWTSQPRQIVKLIDGSDMVKTIRSGHNRRFRLTTVGPNGDCVVRFTVGSKISHEFPVDGCSTLKSEKVTEPKTIAVATGYWGATEPIQIPAGASIVNPSFISTTFMIDLDEGQRVSGSVVLSATSSVNIPLSYSLCAKGDADSKPAPFIAPGIFNAGQLRPGVNSLPASGLRTFPAGKYEVGVCGFATDASGPVNFDLGAVVGYLTIQD